MMLESAAIGDSVVIPNAGVAGVSGSMLPACETVTACKRLRALQGRDLPEYKRTYCDKT